jgi:apolipoprotein N-acyltransferase
MDIYQQEKTERRAWGLGALITTMLVVLLGMGALSSCKPKPATPVATATIVREDTTRKKLVLQVETAADTLLIVHQRSQTAVTDYEKSATAYDTIRVALPQGDSTAAGH